MDSTDPTPTKNRIFYGWWIVIAGGIGMSISSGLTNMGFTNFIIPLTREFGWSRTVISTVFSLARLESGLIGPIEGWAVDRIGPRKLMLVGMPLMGLGFVLMSQVGNLLTFSLVFIFLITLGKSLGSGAPVTATVVNWFQRRRGLVFGIMWSGVGLGGLFVPVLGWAVDEYGWRTASMIIGICIVVVGVPIATVMRHRPEPYGYYPDGMEPEERPASEGSPRLVMPALSREFSAREALATSSFWFLTLSIAARSLGTGGIGLHLVPYLVGLGASPVRAAALAGAVGLMSIPGRFGISTLGDYVDRRYLMAASLGAMSVAIVFMATADRIGQVVPVLIAFAMSQGGIAVIPKAIIADYFGRGSYATIHGFSGSVQMFGIIIGPIIAGYVFDKTDSYSTAFLSFSVATLVSLVLVLLASPPVRVSRRGRLGA